MTEIIYKDRASGEIKKEKVYGKFFLEALYGSGLFAKFCSIFFLPLISHIPFLSSLYGKRQKKEKSKKKIAPFIRDFKIDTTEFADPISHFRSFNDFFIRRLKPEARPIDPDEKKAILPADGRYLVFPDLSKSRGFYVKGKKFDLRQLVGTKSDFELFKKGSMMIARLCPTDYHRFHFVCACIPGEPRLINGPLYSVNPIALRKHISILNENKRVMTLLDGGAFGKIGYLEVGATCVGSICQTYTPKEVYKKGAEKGYFEFGGSCLILLFEPNKIEFDRDLVEASKKQIETYAKMGGSLGRCKSGSH